MRFWRNLSVSKKLYSVTGIMALLIALELFTLLFAMNTLSAVRSFMAAQAAWTRAQKNSANSLYQYLFTRDVKYHAQFHEYLKVPLGIHVARLEILKPNPDPVVLRESLLQGQMHPDDVPGVVSLLSKARNFEHIKKTMGLWKNADDLIMNWISLADQVHADILNGKSPQEVQAQLPRIEAMNAQFTMLGNRFTQNLGIASRRLEMLLMIAIIGVVLTVEGTGLSLVFSLSRNITRSLKELIKATSNVGKGQFHFQVPVRSEDELGQLAQAVNRMTADLQKSQGQRIQAETANQIKTLFLANVSHEIRTPLGIILGLTEILKEGNLSPEDYHRYISTIEKTGKNLTRIINDILDVSRVEAGHIDIENSEFDLSEFLDDLYSFLHIKAEKNDNRLIFLENKDIPTLCTDRNRLRQILVNVINNALKFTQGGSVTLRFFREGAAVHFEISDTGIGIDEKDQARLFKPFSQIDDSSTRQHEGTGLGLLLSKKLAQALGGDVVLTRSHPGQGSTFLVSITPPTAQIMAETLTASHAGTPHAVIPKLKGKKVLIVDDIEDNRLLANLFLNRQGIDMDFAVNGKEALAKAKEKKYDVILMDMQMPVMDGYTAVKTLRERGDRTPIIAVTAHAMKEDREKCLQVGCDSYLTKPLDARQLYNTISQSLPT